MGATIVDALSTGQCIHLPNVKKSSNLVKSYLGFDPIHKQFKVLLNTATPGVSDEHQVLTLGTPNHSWRKVKCCCISYCYPHSNDGICINGGVYYVAAVNMDPFVNAIVCFDVKSEKLRIVYKAKEDMLLWSDSTLVNYKGKLGAFVGGGPGVGGVVTGQNFELWVLVRAGQINRTRKPEPNPIR
uniref:F-box associated beta-propeller type 3 domain-containing protein n=1 Tax=Brassica oleracea var. oleracea TaxID=109376 RepID=A0A0D3CYL0_BRAOL